MEVMIDTSIRIFLEPKPNKDFRKIIFSGISLWGRSENVNCFWISERGDFTFLLLSLIMLNLHFSLLKRHNGIVVCHLYQLNLSNLIFSFFSPLTTFSHRKEMHLCRCTPLIGKGLAAQLASDATILVVRPVLELNYL